MQNFEVEENMAYNNLAVNILEMIRCSLVLVYQSFRGLCYFHFQCFSCTFSFVLKNKRWYKTNLRT